MMLAISDKDLLTAIAVVIFIVISAVSNLIKRAVQSRQGRAPTGPAGKGPPALPRPQVLLPRPAAARPIRVARPGPRAVESALPVVPVARRTAGVAEGRQRKSTAPGAAAAAAGERVVGVSSGAIAAVMHTPKLGGLRRAVVLAELLRPPVAMRGGETDHAGEV
jgi:hypothetical protein